MRAWLPRLLCLLTLVACVPLAHAQTHPHVYRCTGAHGEPVFSGQPCGTPVPAPGRDEAADAGTLGGFCADSPHALRSAIATAFAAHDVNRLSGLILWSGLDQAEARARLLSLSGWLEQPLVGIAIAYPAGPPPTEAGKFAGVAGTPAPGFVAATPIGFRITTGGDGDTRDFGVTESGGCWLLIPGT